MPWAVGALLLWLAALVVEVSAAAPPANRYLLVVETSHTMQRRKDGAIQVTHDLLASQMGGQLHRGDTLGVWTFNAELYAGKFPLELWGPNSATTAPGKVREFLQSQKWEKSANLEKAWPVLQRVIKDSDFITVILISSGEANLQGTPFDDQINPVYKTWRKQQADAKMPFVTVLRAQRGTIVDYSVSQAPWKAELPALPKELLVKESPRKSAGTNAAAAAAPHPPAPMLPPLIVSGKKPEATPQPKPATTNPTASAASVLPQPPDAAKGSPPPSENAIPHGTDSSNTAPLVPTNSALPAVPGPHDPVQTQAAAAEPGVPPPPASPSLKSNSPAKPAVGEITSPPTPSKPPATADLNSPLPGAQTGPSSSNQAAVQIATAASTAGGPTKNLVWLAALVLAAGVAVAGAFWAWRSRSNKTGHTSFITRSLDHKDE